MIRLSIYLVLAAAVLLGVMGVDGLEGSKHDFSDEAWSEGRLCLPCHVPHDASNPAVAPLWDRAKQNRDGYELYSGRKGTPGYQSLVCLSCHDGSAAVDAFGGRPGEVFIQDLAGERSLIGAHGDLSSDHPVGVPYPDHESDYRSRTEVEAGGQVVLPEGRVECTSCHDVHNTYGYDKMLVKSNDRSALCLTCHRK
jgi:predicted CXXCH cytochrome family protein